MTDISPEGAVRKDTVLIVDDEPDVRDSLESLLKSALTDVEVVQASDGQEGLTRLKAGGIDLIISDFKMPGMDGVEFLREARRLAPDIPRIMMTAFADVNIAVGAINKARIESFFTKPLDPEKVIEVVWDTLDRHWEGIQKEEASTRSLDSLRSKDPMTGEQDR